MSASRGFVVSVLYATALLGQVFLPHQTEGKLIRGKDDKVIGSALIAQPFTSAEYFQPRPSAVSYDAAAFSPFDPETTSPSHLPCSAPQYPLSLATHVRGLSKVFELHTLFRFRTRIGEHGRTVLFIPRGGVTCYHGERAGARS
jgi:hypothetical protein